MKTRKIILSLVLCLCAFLPIFALAGCGNVPVSEVKSSFTDLQTTYNKYSDIFSTGTVEEGLTSNYKVDYGVNLDEISAGSNKEMYDSLVERYNVMLAISSKYIDSNKAYVAALEEKELSEKTRVAINELNAKLTKYIKYIPTFATERNSFKDHFKNFAGNEQMDLAVLRNFKKSYGELVSKNIDLALATAKVVETTEIFDILQATVPTQKDVRIVKEYISAKLLPIFNELLIAETETSFNYYYDGYDCEAKTKIEEVVEDLESKFDYYKKQIVSSTATLKGASGDLSKEEMKDLFDILNDFSVEMKDYLKSVEKLDIAKLILESKTFEKHKKEIVLADVYYEKIDQFVSISLPNYMQNLVSEIFVG